MKNAVKAIIFMLVGFATTANAQQKIGYLNAQAILADMSEMKAADSQLEAFAKALTNKDSLMVIAFQAKAQALGEKQQKGEIAPIELEKQKKALEEEQAKSSNMSRTCSNKWLKSVKHCTNRFLTK